MNKTKIYQHFHTLKAKGDKHAGQNTMREFGLNNHQRLYQILQEVENPKPSKKESKEKRLRTLWEGKYIHKVIDNPGKTENHPEMESLVKEMHADGFSIKKISECLQIDWRTARKLVVHSFDLQDNKKRVQ